MCTVVPDHEFVLGMAGGLSSSHHCKNVGFVDHFNDSNSCSEITGDDQFYFLVKFIYFKALLCGDGEVGLILVEAGVYYLLFFFIFLHKDY